MRLKQACHTRTALPAACCRLRVIHSPCNTPHAARKRGVAMKAASAYDPVLEAVPSLFSGDDFYTILGLAPSAEQRDLKRAYHAMMREYHPDRSGTEESAEFCVLLNEIYDTLSDPDRRAVYDAIAGFSIESINPFLDASFARDQVFVDELSCIGCGKCVRACIKTFEIEASKYGRARVISQTEDPLEDIQIAIESCPVDCIHWVSLPQLSLLEVALGSMARIEVSVMQRFGRSAGNVFEAASKAWERRQAIVAARSAVAYSSRVDWSFWGTHSLQYEEGAEQRAAAQDPQQRKIANLAAAAARAARLWRVYNGARAGLRTLTATSSAH